MAAFGYSRSAIATLRDQIATHDVAVVNGLWQYNSVAARSAFRGQLPYVVFSHGMLDPWFNKQYPLKAFKKKIFWQLFQHAALRDAAAVCFTTEEEKQLARQSFQPYQVQEEVVSYGTASPPPATEAHNEAFFNTCPNLRGKPYLLYLSRIHPKKGCDLLIEAFAQIAKAQPRAPRTQRPAISHRWSRSNWLG